MVEFQLGGVVELDAIFVAGREEPGGEFRVAPGQALLDSHPGLHRPEVVLGLPHGEGGHAVEKEISEVLAADDEDGVRPGCQHPLAQLVEP